MTAWLKRWSALGGAALVAAAATLTAVGVNQCNRHDDALETRGKGLGDLTQWRAGVDRHINWGEEKERQITGKLDTIDRRTARLEAGQLAQLAWMQSVSARLGVPPPPSPAHLQGLAAAADAEALCRPDPLDNALALRLEKSP